MAVMLTGSTALIVERDALKAENERLRAALAHIKGAVVGDKNPRWSDDWQVTHMRGRIADICDTALGTK